MSLMAELDAGDKKGLFASNDTFVNYSTGILPLDYANGFWLTVDTGEGYQKVPVTGIMGGTFVSVIGPTGSGKSTFADQMGYSIIKPFADGMLFHIDCELTNLKERMVQVTGTDPRDDRLRLKKEFIHIEDTMDMFNDICRVKEESGNLYKYEVEDRTFDRKKFLAYVPTVFVIDSLPSFNSKENRTDENLGSNMDAARAAKDVTRFFTNCLGRMMRYNITIITINHIVPKVVADPYNQPPKGLMMLKPNEQVNRGYAAQYYSQNYFRLDMIKSNMYKVEDVGFQGCKASIQIAKTKTAFIGGTVDACFNGEIGFDPVFSMFEYAKSIGLIEGRNPFLYLHGLSEFKFSRKDFRSKFLGESVFRNAFMNTVTPYLEAMLGSKELSEQDKVQYGDFMRANDSQMQATDSAEFNPDAVRSNS
jgi:KaiC/GvpD/RAD55 family RecA-like ATPase